MGFGKSMPMLMYIYQTRNLRLRLTVPNTNNRVGNARRTRESFMILKVFGNTLLSFFYLPSQSKFKLRRKRRSKIVKKLRLFKSDIQTPNTNLKNY